MYIKSKVKAAEEVNKGALLFFIKSFIFFSLTFPRNHVAPTKMFVFRYFKSVNLNKYMSVWISYKVPVLSL